MSVMRFFLVWALTAAAAASAATLRWSSAGDLPSWDIHTQNNALGNGIQAMVYEALFTHDEGFQLRPALATGATPLSPTQLRVTLRRGVRFHDGSPFTADDAVFSLQRAMAPTSNFGIYTQGIERIVKVDDLTIDIHTVAPNPVLLRQLTELRMMSKGWAERYRAVTPMDLKGRDENHAHRHANGTGPYRLESWQPDVRLRLIENRDWWGLAEGRKTGNVTEVVYVPIKAEATRVAALLSGEIDMVLDPGPADLPRLRTSPTVKVIDGVENRTIFFGLDLYRDELPGSNIKGRNPLKDLRVRQALSQAIDASVIQRSIMRGLSAPTGTLVPPQVTGWNAALDRRLPHDLAAARRLMTEAGFADGFEVDFACPNNRYINDEKICQAVAAMWARIGVKAKLRTMPLVSYFPMLQRYEASIFMLGWGVPTFDALYTLQSLVHSVGAQGDGNYNVGRYSNPEADALIDRIKQEGDPARRTTLMAQALALAKREVSHIPLHHQVIPWAMKVTVTMPHRADNRIDMPTVHID